MLHLIIHLFYQQLLQSFVEISQIIENIWKLLLSAGKVGMTVRY